MTTFNITFKDKEYRTTSIGGIVLTDSLQPLGHHYLSLNRMGEQLILPSNGRDNNQARTSLSRKQQASILPKAGRGKHWSTFNDRDWYSYRHNLVHMG